MYLPFFILSCCFFFFFFERSLKSRIVSKSFVQIPNDTFFFLDIARGGHRQQILRKLTSMRSSPKKKERKKNTLLILGTMEQRAPQLQSTCLKIASKGPFTFLSFFFFSARRVHPPICTLFPLPPSPSSRFSS